MISREIADKVFCLMESRGIEPVDCVAVNLYNSGPTLHIEPDCMLQAFASESPVYEDHNENLHAVLMVDGIRVVAMFSTDDEMERLREVGTVKTKIVRPESSEVAF